MGSTLEKASCLKIHTIREEFEKEKNELNKQLSEKNREIAGFGVELEVILKEMETLNVKQAHKLK